MKRRKRKTSSRVMIYIAVIVSLSLMGVGYGYWSDGLQMNVGITTGNIDVQGQVDGYSNLNIRASDDNSNLYISGDIYKNASEDLTIKILDLGSVPVRLEGIDMNSPSGIADLYKQSTARYRLSSFVKDDVVEEFQLSISPSMNHSEDLMMESSTFSIQEDIEEDDEIQRRINEIQEEINDLENEINRLNAIEYHDFRYDLRFIQGL